MTSHSEHGACIRGISAESIVGTGPADTAAARDGLVNNLNHLLDECTQHRASIAPRAGEYFTSDVFDLDTFDTFFGLYPLRMPLQIREDGRSVLVVPKLRAAVSAGTLTLRCFLSLDARAPFGILPAPPVGDECSEVSTSSTSAVDLTPDPIFIPSAVYESARAARADRRVGLAYPSLTGSGGPGLAWVPIAYLHVQLAISASATPKLFGLSAREYIG